MEHNNEERSHEISEPYSSIPSETPRPVGKASTKIKNLAGGSLCCYRYRRNPVAAVGPCRWGQPWPDGRDSFWLAATPATAGVGISLSRPLGRAGEERLWHLEAVAAG
ncbi:hypothetical protein L484_024386 [Morus notabilis]|uniref:Uncharacterized protein n=1 Tax=Morus notabilis TaxID=981085 RepID=W9RX10_9ROSA|nr:hypothetical protein L484_024386 [Morus notabilis]